MVPEILFVEDNEDIREISAKLLGKGGNAITPAANGVEALNLFRHRKFDLIITDIFMPEMDGNEFIAELAKYSNLPPIIALSYNHFDIKPNPVISLIGLKPMKTEKLRLLVYQAFLDLSRDQFAS